MRQMRYGVLALAAIIVGCTEKNVTNNYGPTDWQPPEVQWVTPPEAEVRGTVGLDVAVTDSSQIAEVKFFVNGLETSGITAPPYRLTLITDSLLDGVHLVEARARDEYGNLGVSPILRINVANSLAQGPRLIWVPDDYARIQDAINAAIDFDTIRVRDGTYYETLNLFGKGIWLESEHGPTRCILDAQHAHNACFAPACGTELVIRGLTIRHAGHTTVEFDDGVRFRFLNNIVQADTENVLIYLLRTSGMIHNNLLIARYVGLQIWSLQGTVFNNIFEESAAYAMWNANYAVNPVVYGYNMFWRNEHDYFNFDPGPGDLHGDPMLDLLSGRLLTGSPAVSSGNPTILDRDSSRSDIGPFGGPWAYTQ
ncbi:hypothetical protein HZB60_02145 [candidate division KSB1 bacterium]|nr:hypothetical protein [candidate division KSB1 bacterium]